MGAGPAAHGGVLPAMGRRTPAAGRVERSAGRKKFFMERIKIKIFISSFALLAFLAGCFFLSSKKDASKDAQEFGVELPAVFSDPIKIVSSDAALLIKPLGASRAQAEERLTGGVREIRYVGGYSQTDAVEKVYGTKIKEELVLKGAGHPGEFSYSVNFKDFKYRIDEQGNIEFYALERGEGQPEALVRIFRITAPFMIDADQVKSSTKDVKVSISGNILKIVPSAQWIKKHKYPIVLDPSVEIAVLNIYSHPLQGEEWIVSFTTRGKADFSIIPNDEATVKEDEFSELWCGNQKRTPQILAGDTIFYKDWQCADVGRVVHKTLKGGDHTLRFEFGDEIAYAYNHFSGDHKYAWSENAGWLNASSTYEKIALAADGLTGYMWGENIGWVKLDYDGIAGAANTSETDWGVTNDGHGNLGGYAWGENIGWVNFHPDSSQVKINPDTDRLTGFAWSENIGWINFGHGLHNYEIEFNDAPLTTTYAASNIGSRTATLNGRALRMTSDITERGFKYGLTEADAWSISESGSFGSQDFKLVIENLTASTTYYFRAYAINAEGTNYGEYASFNTEAVQKGSPIILKEKTILKKKTILK